MSSNEPNLTSNEVSGDVLNNTLNEKANEAPNDGTVEGDSELDNFQTQGTFAYFTSDHPIVQEETVETDHLLTITTEAMTTETINFEDVSI